MQCKLCSRQIHLSIASLFQINYEVLKWLQKGGRSAEGAGCGVVRLKLLHHGCTWWTLQLSDWMTNASKPWCSSQRDVNTYSYIFTWDVCSVCAHVWRLDEAVLRQLAGGSNASKLSLLLGHTEGSSILLNELWFSYWNRSRRHVLSIHINAKRKQAHRLAACAHAQNHNECACL